MLVSALNSLSLIYFRLLTSPPPSLLPSLLPFCFLSPSSSPPPFPSPSPFPSPPPSPSPSPSPFPPPSPRSPQPRLSIIEGVYLLICSVKLLSPFGLSFTDSSAWVRRTHPTISRLSTASSSLKAMLLPARLWPELARSCPASARVGRGEEKRSRKTLHSSHGENSQNCASSRTFFPLRNILCLTSMGGRSAAQEEWQATSTGLIVQLGDYGLRQPSHK